MRVENLPAVQKVTGEVSLKEIRTLVIGLNEIIKGLKIIAQDSNSNAASLLKKVEKEPPAINIDLTGVEKAVKSIKIPETIIPAHPESITISNLSEIQKYLNELGQKFNIPAPIVTIPPYPKTVTVGNLEAIERTLESISAKLDKQEADEATAYSWTKDKNGRLQTFTEYYPDGKVISTGWNVGSVVIKDERKP